MSKNWKYATLVTGLTLLLSACGNSFQAGQKAWIDLPGKSVFTEGYAVVKVLKINGTNAQVRIDKLVPGKNSRLQRKLKSRRAVIAVAVLKPYKEGRVAWKDRRKAALRLAAMLRRYKNDPAGERFVDRVVDNNQVPALSAALALYRIRQSYLSGKTSRSERVANIPYALGRIKSLAKKHQAYQTVLDHLSGRTIYSTSDGRHSVSVVIRSGRQIRGHRKKDDKRMRANLFTRRAASTVRDMRALANAAANSQVPALTMVKNIPAIIRAEEAIIDFVSDQGKRYSKVAVSKIMAIRKRQIGQGLVPGIRAELIKKADLSTARSEQEAVSRFNSAAAEARQIEQQLGVTIFPASARQQWFVSPVRRHLARLKKEQAMRYRIAVNRLQPMDDQDKAIRRYLKDYPDGKYVDKVKAEQQWVAKQKQIAAETHARRLKKLMMLMTSRHQYQGVAGYQRKQLRFKLKISQFNKKNGKFSGRITWPEKKGAVNKITGKLDPDKLSIEFREVTMIKRGSWRPGSQYRLIMASDSSMKGVHSYRYFVFPKKRVASLRIK